MEIEKKFLIDKLPKDLDTYEKWEIEQAYLCGNPTVRIRKRDDKYILTYKSHQGMGKLIRDSKARVCNEVELPLTKTAYEHLLEKHDDNIVTKTRYIIPLDKKHKIELDVFKGKLEGLVMAEVEFESTEDAKSFEPPRWFGEDVTGDDRFSNRKLSRLEKYDLKD
ncbi:MAG: CYTH domain-containing protein [Lachnospiraceae bacterium]|nr:CYTH domain-containing protein [Lachnospiraceae bacterium]MBP5250757.1 CYTH domain-containing protein [Lachnospiraceae bacterium]